MTLLGAASYHNADLGTFDFPGTFLFAKPTKKHYMRLGKDVADVLVRCYPKFSHLQRSDGTLFVKLTGALYGLPESGKIWYETICEQMFQMGFDRCREDPCLFHKESTRGKLIISLHVDDGLYMSTDGALTQELLEKLERRFGKIKHNNGDNLSFLGLNIKKERGGVITISQPAFIEDILDNWDTKEVATTPATRDLLKVDEASPPIESKIFLSHVMKLMYVATKTRPDILFAVSYPSHRDPHTPPSMTSSVLKGSKHTSMARGTTG
jgi:hypothetical protein